MFLIFKTVAQSLDKLKSTERENKLHQKVCMRASKLQDDCRSSLSGSRKSVALLAGRYGPYRFTLIRSWAIKSAYFSTDELGLFHLCE